MAATQSAAWRVGDLVDIKGHGRAEIIEPMATEPGHKFAGRVRVRYERDGSTYYCRPEVLRRVAPKPAQRVVVCHTTKEYKAAAIAYLSYKDACLEVGCHEGETTYLLSLRCRYVVGVDKSIAAIEKARTRFPTVPFHVVDGFDTNTLWRLGPPEPLAPPAEEAATTNPCNSSTHASSMAVTAPLACTDGSNQEAAVGAAAAASGDGNSSGCSNGGFDVILVDIGGTAELHSVLSLVGLCYRAFPHALLIVKSVFMRRFVQDCMPFISNAGRNWIALDAGAGVGGEGAGAEDEEQ